MKKIVVTLGALAALLCALPSAAQTFPAQPVKIISPTPAGSSSDMLARVLADQIQKDTGSTWLVENRPGALGTIASEQVARAPADGYTLHLSSVSTHAQVPFLMKNVPYNVTKDFEHVARLAVFEWLIVADPKKGYNTLQDLIAAAKKSPGKLNFAYGTASSLAGMAEFNKLAGIEAVGVAYKGQPPALADVAGGRIDYMLVDVNVSAPMIMGGRLKPLAVTSPTRAPRLPNVPTMAEAGMPGFEFIGWVGLSAPAKTPAAAVQWISQQVRIALSKPDVIKRLTDAAITPAYMPTPEFKTFIDDELARWGRRIPAAGIRPE
ncbi:MAG: tripartite tricarboxylate transporter substrate binding protein [Burkholderiaceae bacterium]|nr:tripartite tricarboxylate transporter substrate binding protein [Burkholderiaceae bacterium]